MPRIDQAFRPLRFTVVLDRLAGTHFALLRYIESTASTNGDASGVLGARASRGLTTFAEYQTRGAGRKGRAWIAPIGSSLLFTTILPEPLVPAQLWAVPLWTGLAVAEGIEIACGLRAELQWPNDLLYEGRKLAGILCTSKVRGSDAWAACGIGVNVLRPAEPGELAEIEPPPAFVHDAVAHVEREDVLVGILGRFEANLAFLSKPDVIVQRWETRGGLPGRAYRVRLDATGEELEGKALRLGAHGELVAQREDGSEVVIDAGDARVVR